MLRYSDQSETTTGGIDQSGGRVGFTNPPGQYSRLSPPLLLRVQVKQNKTPKTLNNMKTLNVNDVGIHVPFQVKDIVHLLEKEPYRYHSY